METGLIKETGQGDWSRSGCSCTERAGDWLVGAGVRQTGGSVRLDGSVVLTSESGHTSGVQ